MTVLTMVASGILLGIVWSPVPPYELNLVEVSGSGGKVVVYPKEPPAFKPPEHDVRWFSLYLFLGASQPLDANVSVYARTKDPAQDPSCVPLNARFQNPNVRISSFVYACTVSADDSKVGEASFKNAKYASLKELPDFSASKIIEGIERGRLWLGVDPSGLPPTPLTLQLRLSGAGYVSPSPRLLNIALIGFLLFLMGQAIYHFAMRVNSSKVVPWKRPLKRLSTFGIALGLAAVLLGVLSDVLNHGIGGVPRSTLFAALSAFAGAPWVLLDIFGTKKPHEDKSPLACFAATASMVVALGLALAFLLHFLSNYLVLLASSVL